MRVIKQDEPLVHLVLVLFYLIRSVDYATTMPTWLGAYNKSMRLTKGNEMESIKFADGVVRRTQPAGSMENMAAVMRGNAFQKLFTSFMTHFSNVHNQMVTIKDYAKYSKDPNFKKLATTMRGLMWVWIIPAILSSFIRKGGKTTPKEIAKEVALYPFGGLFLLRDLTNSILKGYDFGKSPAMSGGQEISWAVNTKDTKKRVFHGLKAIGMLTGKIPVQVVNFIEGAIALHLQETLDWRRLIYTESALEAEGDNESAAIY